MYIVRETFAKASYPCIAEKFGEKNFTNAAKVTILNTIFTHTIIKLISMIKFSQMRAGGEIGENFCVYSTQCHTDYLS